MKIKGRVVTDLKTKISEYKQHELDYEKECRDHPNRWPKNGTTGYASAITLYGQLLQAVQKGKDRQSAEEYVREQVCTLSDWVHRKDRGVIYLPMYKFWQRLLIVFILEGNDEKAN